ncbi:MAG: hypothetical protein ACKKL6_01845 [Candidatus Komeilibacteria bacterium]
MIGSEGHDYNEVVIPITCEAGCCLNKVTHVVMFTTRPLFICEDSLETYNFMPIKTLEEYKKDVE